MWRGTRVWIQSWWGFTRDALAPIRALNNVVQELGVAVVGIVAFILIAQEWGAAWAVVVAVALFTALFAAEGTRREHRQRVVMLSFSPQEPELVASGNGEFWKLVVRVENLGPTGVFTATCVDTTGTHEGTSEFEFPWDGKFEIEQRIRHGRSGYIDVAYSYPRKMALRFALPPTTYSGPHEHSISPIKTGTGPAVTLTLEVADVDRDFARCATVTITFDSGSGVPELLVSETYAAS